MNNSRSQNVFKSGTITAFAQVVSLLLAFLIRKKLIQYMGIDYLGLNGVITDVISMLSLSELGVQSAVIYRLYKPIACENWDEISQIICFLKKVYQITGMVIFIAGMCLLPFIDVLVTNTKIAELQIRISFAIVLASTVLSYFVSYKRTLLYADQKQYVISSADMAVNVCCSVLKLAAVIVWKNFYIFLSIQIVQTLVSNFILNRYAGKMYVRLHSTAAVGKDVRSYMLQDITNVFAGKFAVYIYASTDNVFTSVLAGTAFAGMLGNYKTIFLALNTLYLSAFSSIRPAIGNYLLRQSVQESYELFKKYSFVRYAAAVVTFVPAFLLSDAFIALFYGQQFLMSEITVILIALDLYIGSVNGAASEYIESMGYFKNTRDIYLAGAFTNLILSVLCGIKWGVNGVLAGTVISQILMGAGRNQCVFQSYFKNRQYYVQYMTVKLLYFINTVVLSCAGIFVLQFVKIQNYYTFVLCGAAIEAVCAGELFMVFRKSEEYCYFMDILKSNFKKVSDKIRQKMTGLLL